MVVAGIDIGSLSVNSVVLSDGRIVSWSNIRATPNVEETAMCGLNKAVEKTGLSIKDLEYVVSTGYGREAISFSNKHVTEIACHARGSNWLFPEVRTILDMGGQDCKAIRCDEKGRVTNFIMNDKCAAGTGRYLEMVASTLEIPLEEIGPLSLDVKKEPAVIENYCAVFAQRDILIMLREGKNANDILAGVCEAVAKRVLQLLRRVEAIPILSISGGIAKNIGVVTRIEDTLKLKSHIAFEPQVVGALGAALFAQDQLLREMKS